MLDTDALLLQDPRAFYFGALSNVSDVLVSSDCVSSVADATLVRARAHAPPAPAYAHSLRNSALHRR